MLIGGSGLSAVSANGVTASGYFDYMRFSRATAGEVALQVQQDLMTLYGSRYPAVTQHHGLEVSRTQHVNWYGGSIALPQYPAMHRSQYDDYLRYTIVPDIHQRGGLASYNHPYGTGFSARMSVSAQDERLVQMATRLLNNWAFGTDILEVGYPLRAGVDISHHVGLWDVCSRNALFLTGNGVSDDHKGVDWLNDALDWTTSVWSADKSEAVLLDALRAGRAWCGSLSGYGGALDLSVDGSCPMGSATVSQAVSRSLTVTATDVPPGGSVEVVQGVVDDAGVGAPTPATQIIASQPGETMPTGMAALAVDTNRSSFVRAQVKDATGQLIGLSNPVWLLRETPSSGIPAARSQ